MGFLTRAGLFICAAIIIFLARRLHAKASGKQEKVQKITATIIAFIGGLALLGTFVGDWMGKVSKASPYVAAGLFLLTFLGVLIDWWTDKKPDKFAFYCAMFLPLSAVFGLTQMSHLSDQTGKSWDRVQSTVEQSSR